MIAGLVDRRLSSSHNFASRSNRCCSVNLCVSVFFSAIGTFPYW